MNEATVTLQRCKETNETSQKSDSYFTSVYRKYRNLAKKRQLLYKGVKKLTKPRKKAIKTLHGCKGNVARRRARLTIAKAEYVDYSQIAV